jgi:predicted nuclease of restriction endonuclease-like (RecB) superfamily
VLDFVQLSEGARERELELALLADIERFMLALGEGFYFAGRQKSLQVGGQELVLDLLFYHHPTRRFVVIDLKLGAFKAEFAGKMNLYVNAVNEFVAHPEDRATVGFILCTDLTRPSPS